MVYISDCLEQILVHIDLIDGHIFAKSLHFCLNYVAYDSMYFCYLFVVL